MHTLHTAPEDLGKYKGYENPTSRGEQKHWDEVSLCKCADLVVPVGPKLMKAYFSYLMRSHMWGTSGTLLLYFAT